MTNKRETKQERIRVFKERFETYSTEKILKWLTNMNTTKEAAIAYKQVLKERGITDYLEDNDNIK